MYLEQLETAGPNALVGSGGHGKYDCTRSLESARAASGLPGDVAALHGTAESDEVIDAEALEERPVMRLPAG